MTCASIYSSDFNGDYGDGPGAAIWIDNLGTDCCYCCYCDCSDYCPDSILIKPLTQFDNLGTDYYYYQYYCIYEASLVRFSN